MIQEQSIEELSKKVVEEISVQHPIMYDTQTNYQGFLYRCFETCAIFTT